MNNSARRLGGTSPSRARFSMSLTAVESSTWGKLAARSARGPASVPYGSTRLDGFGLLRILNLLGAIECRGMFSPPLAAERPKVTATETITMKYLSRGSIFMRF